MSNYNVLIKTLSPIHIGGAQEKNAIKNIDFIVKGDRLLLLNEDKLMAELGPDEYSRQLEKASLHRFFDNNDVDPYVEKDYQINGEVGSDLKMHISDTMSGKPYLPGSSLKGAIRSLFISSEKMIRGTRYDRRNQRNVNTLNEPFGKTSEDAFRYLQITDCHFDNDVMLNTKTYTLVKDNGLKGGWKHQNYSDGSFYPSGFCFAYQCIPKHQVSRVRITLNSESYKSSASTSKKTSIFNTVTKDESSIWQVLQQEMEKYLEAEIKFFQKYTNEHTDQIISQLSKILNANKVAPVVRVGQGSGFHSITGNHLFPTDHGIHDFGYRNRGLLNGKDSAKTRKLAFTKIDNSWVFYPMGFVQLIHKTMHHEKYDQLLQELDQQRQKQRKLEQDLIEAEKVKAANLIRQEEEKKKAAIEAKKPKMLSKIQFKKNKARTIDAEVIRSERGRISLKVFVQEFVTEVYEVSYHAGYPIGTIVTIDAQLISKGKKLQLQGRPQPK